MEIENVMVESSARHIHISKKDAEILFGKDYKLIPIKELSQKDFLSDKTINIINNNEKFENVAVLGPEREATQIEISISDAFKLKLNKIPPIRESGNLKDTPGITLGFKDKSIELKEGLIIAKRHLHVSEEESKKYNLKNNQIVTAKIKGEREAILKEIPVRIKHNFSLSLHLDTDECNAVGINKKGECYIIID